MMAWIVNLDYAARLTTDPPGTAPGTGVAVGRVVRAPIQGRKFDLDTVDRGVALASQNRKKDVTE